MGRGAPLRVFGQGRAGPPRPPSARAHLATAPGDTSPRLRPANEAIDHPSPTSRSRGDRPGGMHSPIPEGRTDGVRHRSRVGMLRISRRKALVGSGTLFADRRSHRLGRGRGSRRGSPHRATRASASNSADPAGRPAEPTAEPWRRPHARAGRCRASRPTTRIAAGSTSSHGHWRPGTGAAAPGSAQQRKPVEKS